MPIVDKNSVAASCVMGLQMIGVLFIQNEHLDECNYLFLCAKSCVFVKSCKNLHFHYLCISLNLYNNYLQTF